MQQLYGLVLGLQKLNIIENPAAYDEFLTRTERYLNSIALILDRTEGQRDINFSIDEIKDFRESRMALTEGGLEEVLSATSSGGGLGQSK